METETLEMIETENNDRAEVVGCDLKDLLFPVHKIKNPQMTNREYSRTVVGRIKGERVHLNYCSPLYQLVPNRLIFPRIEEILQKHGIEYEVTYKHINNVRFYAEYRITDKRYTYKMKGTKDVIYPLIKVQHSYNGQTKYKIIFGYFRFICSNGLVIAVEQMKQYNLVIVGKHTEQILHSFDELNAMLENFGKNAKQVTADIVAKYELLGGRMVTDPKDRITEVMKAVKLRVIENTKFNTVNDIMSRITEELGKPELAGYNGKVNDWLIYNGINQYLYSDRTLVAPEFRMESDSKVFEYMIANA